jgi:hypothetical protein
MKLAPVQPPIGIQFEEQTAWLIAGSGGVSKGALVLLSSENADFPLPFDTATTATAAGAGSDVQKFYGIATADAAAGAKVRVLMSGRCDFALTTGTINDGSRLEAGAGVLTLTTGVSGTPADMHKILAIALEADGADNIGAVLFDGVNGFGTVPVA